MNPEQAKTMIERIIKNETEEQADARIKAEWLHKFNRAINPPGELARVSVAPCQPIIGKWFKQGDLGFICGPRGLGKTWLAMLLARKCAEGTTLGGLTEWQIHGSRRVLYVDGEMSLDAIRERDQALSVGPAQGIFYLQHEALFQLTGSVLNLAEPQAQAALLEKCRQDRIDILFLDNLSCLFSGMRENDADAWERVLPWLLDLRRNRIAVVFVAHCGRNGMMRGTSRREDAAFWIINLTPLEDTTEDRHGAKFVARFEKNRNTSDADCPALEWRFARFANDPKAHVSWKKIIVPDVFRRCIEDGMTTATEIAQEMSLSRGQVSKYAARAIREGWLRKKGRGYVLMTEHPMASVLKTPAAPIKLA